MAQRVHFLKEINKNNREKLVGKLGIEIIDENYSKEMKLSKQIL